MSLLAFNEQGEIMNCDHQFIKIRDVGNRVVTKGYGAVAGCVLCGQGRTVWEDGSIDIKPTEQKNEHSSAS